LGKCLLTIQSQRQLNQQFRWISMDTRVSIVRCSDYSGVKGAIKEALNLIGGLSLNKTSVEIVDYKFQLIWFKYQLT